MNGREWRCFWAGALAHVGALSLLHDWMGLEGYVSWCRENWLPARITVPVAILTLAGAYWLVPQRATAQGGRS